MLPTLLLTIHVIVGECMYREYVVRPLNTWPEPINTAPLISAFYNIRKTSPNENPRIKSFCWWVYGGAHFAWLLVSHSKIHAVDPNSINSFCFLTVHVVLLAVVGGGVFMCASSYFSAATRKAPPGPPHVCQFPYRSLVKLCVGHDALSSRTR